MISGTITDASGRTLSVKLQKHFGYLYATLTRFRSASIALWEGRPPPIHSEISRIADIPVNLPNRSTKRIWRYDDTPEELAKCIGEFARGFLNLAGGCCGTPDHIAAIADAGGRTAATSRKPTPFCTLSGLEPLRFGDVTDFVNIGERTNVGTFRKLIWGTMKPPSTSHANK